MAKTYFEQIPVLVVKNAVAALTAGKESSGHSKKDATIIGKPRPKHARVFRTGIKTSR